MLRLEYKSMIKQKQGGCCFLVFFSLVVVAPRCFFTTTTIRSVPSLIRCSPSIYPYPVLFVFPPFRPLNPSMHSQSQRHPMTLDELAECCSGMLGSSSNFVTHFHAQPRMFSSRRNLSYHDCSWRYSKYDKVLHDFHLCGEHVPCLSNSAALQ
jgi:hypothetical protein